jgi:hypothetical protein
MILSRKEEEESGSRSAFQWVGVGADSGRVMREEGEVPVMSWTRFIHSYRPNGRAAQTRACSAHGPGALRWLEPVG